MSAVLERESFTFSRAMEFFTEKELTMQIGYSRDDWPMVLIKELVDNSLDACETIKVSPEIEVTIESDAIGIRDNGNGIPLEVIAESLDYMKRISTNSHYVSPTRGQLGNALKCVWAAPFVIDGESGTVEVEARGIAHTITVTMDHIAQEPRLKHETTDSDVKNGTFVKIHLPQVSSYLRQTESGDFYKHPVIGLLASYALFNPHGSFTLTVDDETITFSSTQGDWMKWTPNLPTSPHWYDAARLQGLIGGYLNNDRLVGRTRSVREFVSEFDGLRGSAKQKVVTESAGLSGFILPDLVQGDSISQKQVLSLLSSMQTHTRPVKPKALGLIGEELITRQMQAHCFVERVWYRKAEGIYQGIPFVIEAALGLYREEYQQCKGGRFIGLNWSPVLKNPFDELSVLLGENRVDSFDPLMFVLHIACPRLEYTERGKGKVILLRAIHEALEKCVTAVTREWKAIKRKADRQERATERDMEELRKARKRRELTTKEACHLCMVDAYHFVAGLSSLSVNASDSARHCLLESKAGDGQTLGATCLYSLLTNADSEGDVGLNK